VVGEDRVKNRSAMTPGRARKKIIDRVPVQNSKHLRLIERPLHRTGVHHLGQVQERARDRGARHAFHLGRVLSP
jgi:hypothetical protein